jgi:hypothetical protein
MLQREGNLMDYTSETGGFRRLEDLIVLAEERKDIHLEIELIKEVVMQKVHPEESGEMDDEIYMYLLIAVYSFSVDSNIIKISKIYEFASIEESVDATPEHKDIANKRLKADYLRLKNAGISFKELYF